MPIQLKLIPLQGMSGRTDSRRFIGKDQPRQFVAASAGDASLPLATPRSGERRLGRRWLAENERESKGHAQAQLADGTAVDRRVAHGCVEGELVVHLPYGPNQTRERLRLGDDAVRIDFKDRPDFPFARSLDEASKKSSPCWSGVRFDAAFK